MGHLRLDARAVGETLRALAESCQWFSWSVPRASQLRRQAPALPRSEYAASLSADRPDASRRRGKTRRARDLLRLRRALAPSRPRHCEDSACTRARLSDLGGATGTPRAGDKTSLAIGSDGLGIIAYHNSDQGVLKVAHCQDDACTAATASTIDDGPHVPHQSGYVGAYPSLTIGRDGLGLISYYEEPVGNLRVAHCADVPCARADVISVIDRGSPTGRVGTYTAVGIGGDGLGLIAYQGSLTDFLNQDLKVAHCQDLACRTATITTVDVAKP
jgi:hypothetical protein